MVHYRFVDHGNQLCVAFSPKAACTTIKRWLLDLVVEAGCNPRPSGIDQVPKEFGELGGLKLFGRYPDYRRVLFVRDPLRRLVSFYAHFVVRDDREWCVADDAAQRPLCGATFREMVSMLEELTASNQRLQHHLVPQTDGIPGDVGFDEIIAIEAIDAGIERLVSLLGRSLPPAPQLNVTDYTTGVTCFAADTSVASLRERGVPTSEWFYDAVLAHRVAELFSADCTMYRAIDGVRLVEPAVP